jgi:hypothetical protein
MTSSIFHDFVKTRFLRFLVIFGDCRKVGVGIFQNID